MEDVSVCLTLYNEEHGVQRVLDYLDSQQKIIDNVIIVSDACKDKTDQLIHGWIKQSHIGTIRFIQRPTRPGRADAIRECLHWSKHDLNVIMAGDIQPLSNSMKNLVHYFRDKKVGAVTGHPILLNPRRTVADYLAYLMWTSHDKVGEIETLKGTFFHLNGEMFAIRKSALNNYDGYNGIGEDAMIGAMIRREGYRVLWAEDVAYYMRYPSSLREWIKIRCRCCFARVDMWKNYGFQDYPYYELSHAEYFYNILMCINRSVKGFLAFLVGASLEALIRLYYVQTYQKKRDLLKDLWEPAEETKW